MKDYEKILGKLYIFSSYLQKYPSFYRDPRLVLFFVFPVAIAISAYVNALWMIFWFAIIALFFSISAAMSIHMVASIMKENYELKLNYQIMVNGFHSYLKKVTAEMSYQTIMNERPLEEVQNLFENLSDEEFGAYIEKVGQRQAEVSAIFEEENRRFLGSVNEEKRKVAEATKNYPGMSFVDLKNQSKDDSEEDEE